MKRLVFLSGSYRVLTVARLLMQPLCLRGKLSDIPRRPVDVLPLSVIFVKGIVCQQNFLFETVTLSRALHRLAPVMVGVPWSKGCEICRIRRKKVWWILVVYESTTNKLSAEENGQTALLAWLCGGSALNTLGAGVSLMRPPPLLRFTAGNGTYLKKLMPSCRTSHLARRLCGYWI